MIKRRLRKRAIYAVCNQKGGVAKTTTAVNLAVGMALEGYSTLLIDCDPQCNASQGVGIDPFEKTDHERQENERQEIEGQENERQRDERQSHGLKKNNTASENSGDRNNNHGDCGSDDGSDGGDGTNGTSCSVYDFIIKRKPLDRVMMQTNVPGLKIIPGSLDLAAVEVEIAHEIGRELRLLSALRDIPMGLFQFVVIDCPPSLGLLTINAIAAATGLIIPVQCEHYAIKGLKQIIDTSIKVRKKFNPGVNIHGILLTMMTKRQRISHQNERFVRSKIGSSVFETTIPRTVSVAESAQYGMSIFHYARKSSASVAYADFTREVIQREKNKQKIVSKI